MSNTSERPKPYIGVSGVVSPEMQTELEGMALEFILRDKNRRIALGVKAVHKTQLMGIENKYGCEWYPVGEELSTSLRSATDNPDTFSVAQIYLEVDHVHNPEYRSYLTELIFQRVSPWVEGLQFDMLPWHDDYQMLSFLDEVKGRYNLPVLLQCHKEAMNELGPKGVVQRLGLAATTIDYLLFDSSHGTGKRMDATKLDSYLEEAYASDDLQEVGMVVAGGLDETAVREDLPMLVTKYPDLSWDAEGKLHPVNSDGKRPLDLDIARSYLVASSDVLSRSADN